MRQEQKAAGWLEAAGREDDLERVVRVWQQEQMHQALGGEMEVLLNRLRQLLELHYAYREPNPRIWRGSGEAGG